MCFGGLTTIERCDRCGRHHPADLTERCLDVAVSAASERLDEELTAFFESAEAQFFNWLAQRPKPLDQQVKQGGSGGT